MQAFTQWLNTVVELPRGYRIQLPSEAEWEKAARGGVKLPSGGESVFKVVLGQIGTAPIDRKGLEFISNPRKDRKYPWGESEAKDKAAASFANYDAAQIGSTSAVGAFPDGLSPYGCEELSGNVWEWTRSVYKDYPYRAEDGREDLGTITNNTWMALRGGSYYSDNKIVRCAFRYRLLPS